MSETDGKHRLVGRCLMVATLDSMATLSAARDGLEAGTISSGLSAMEMVVGTAVSGEPLKQPGLPLARCPAHVRSRFPAPALTMQAGAQRPGVGHARVGLPHARTPSPQGGAHRLDAAAVPGAPTLPESHIFTGAAWIRADGTYS